MANPILSVVVPVFNESSGIEDFHAALKKTLEQIDYEIIYVNDGSSDNTLEKLTRLAKDEPRMRVLSLSRNFGKEIAVTAGVNRANGKAIITIDGDGQHPVELVPSFLKRWEEGHKVVVGIRKSHQKEGWFKRKSSQLFYWLFKKFAGISLTPGATDFRLIDRSVQQEFIKITERNRITRGLIDWLGYEQDFISFEASPRLAGEATYSYKKLLKLAIDSVISLSVSPLFIAAYLGAVILPLSIILGLVMLINALISDPLSLHATGTAYAMVLVLFLIGILLVSQGIIGLYLSHIHAETQNRPLYVIDKDKSMHLDED